MSARTRRWLRVTIIAGWLVLALITVMPVLAQDGSGGTTGLTTAEGSGPDSLDSVAARLAPLLVGAALIERVLEFLFSWAQRTALDATSTLHGLASRLSGGISMDLRHAYEKLDALSDMLVELKSEGLPTQKPEGGAAAVAAETRPLTSTEEWAFADLAAQAKQLEETLSQAEANLKKLLNSPVYKARKKMLAAVLSIVFGILLAFAADLRLFDPLGIAVTNWFEEPFKVVDLILAGVLMGLGTDWVHQMISVLTKGQSLLGARADAAGQIDEARLQALTEQAVQRQTDVMMQQVRDMAQTEALRILGMAEEDDNLPT